MLHELVGEPQLLTPAQREELHQFLEDRHEVFCLEPKEWGETDLLTVEIDTGNAQPSKQPAHRMPFAVQSEVAKQFQSMKETGVIQPSSSPWSGSETEPSA